jgi:hypothetical protein
MTATLMAMAKGRPDLARRLGINDLKHDDQYPQLDPLQQQDQEAQLDRAFRAPRSRVPERAIGR